MLRDAEHHLLDQGSRQCEVLVAGAGPAGLFAALTLVAAGVPDVVLIDAGPDIVERRRVNAGLNPLGGHPDLERGVGGAGLFSDGKLCLSLDVGGHLEESLSARERAWLLAQISDVFSALLPGGLAANNPERGALAQAAAEADRAGLRFKHYPVAHIGTDRCADIVAALRASVARAGVRVVSNAELAELRVEKGGRKSAAIKQSDETVEITANHVILALGKVGANRQAELCAELGIELQPQKIYVGARFETSRQAVAPLFGHTKDPKYSLALSDGSKIKTHCASEGGEVIELRYDGLPLAGGHNYSYAKSARSGFSILWDGFELGGRDSYREAMAIMARAAEFGNGHLVFQRLADLRAQTPSAPETRADSLTCPDAVPGDLRELLPGAFFPAMDAFLARLERVVPGLTKSEDAVLYAPAIEWWMQRVAVADSLMRTSVAGISVCGDGSGWSQGIIHGAATGVLAAMGVRGEKVAISDWVSRPRSDTTAVRSAA